MIFTNCERERYKTNQKVRGVRQKIYGSTYDLVSSGQELNKKKFPRPLFDFHTVLSLPVTLPRKGRLRCLKKGHLCF